MSRLFNGTTDFLRYDVTTLPATNGAFTMLMIAKITAGTGFASLIEGESSSGVIQTAMGRRSDTTLYWSNPSTLLSAITLTNNQWAVHAITKAAGTATPTAHYGVVGSALTHTAFSGTMADGGSVAGGRLKIGGDDDPLTGLIAVAAIFNSVLSNAQLDSISTTKTTAFIHSLSPQWLIDDNDGLTADYEGHASKTSGTSTSDADNPSGWVYGLGGAAATSDIPRRRSDAVLLVR